jgi:tRNA pseudouridine13 synthase
VTELLLKELAAPPTYLTHDLAGVPGCIKTEQDDFEVEEIPAYHPSGTGEHLYLWIEKRGISTDALVHHVARTLGVSAYDIGCAGLKDARAITRQYVSVPATAEPLVSQIDDERVRVLHANRHGNKLKTGHLRGNVFRLVVRCDNVLEPQITQNRLDALATRLRTLGMANFYGEQRFGREGETLQLGLALLQGDTAPLQSVPPGRRGYLRRLALSSVQSALFNVYLRRRMSDSLLHRALPGDLFQVCASGGVFVQPLHDDTLQERFDRREIVPTGPMFGPKMRAPMHEALTREQSLLDSFGISPDIFVPMSKLMPGTRRALIVWPNDLQARVLGTSAYELKFSLPAGSYATVLAEEFA